MKIVLLQNVRGLGRVGETKNVADGYAKNRLIPGKLARPAYTHLVNQITALKKKADVLTAKESEEAKKVVERVSAEDFVIEIKGNANNEGGLYAAISNKDIIKALKENGIVVDVDVVKIKTPIKSVGDHRVDLEFEENVKAKLQLRVQP